MISAEQPARERDDEEASERAWGGMVLAWFIGIFVAVAAWFASILRQFLQDDD